MGIDPFADDFVPVIMEGEVVSEGTYAQQLDRAIRDKVAEIGTSLEDLHVLVVEAKDQEIWLELGFNSWVAYAADALRIHMKLSVESRREYVFMLAGEGMSNRAIADVIGADESTVRADKKSGAGNPAPQDSKVTGKDGKTYERRQPKRDVTDTATVTDAPKGAPGLTGEVTQSSTPPDQAPKQSVDFATNEVMALQKRVSELYNANYNGEEWAYLYVGLESLIDTVQEYRQLIWDRKLNDELRGYVTTK
jgi:hypothetical protein